MKLINFIKNVFCKPRTVYVNRYEKIWMKFKYSKFSDIKIGDIVEAEIIKPYIPTEEEMERIEKQDYDGIPINDYTLYHGKVLSLVCNGGSLIDGVVIMDEKTNKEKYLSTDNICYWEFNVGKTTYVWENYYDLF
jgi:signal peptidase I